MSVITPQQKKRPMSQGSTPSPSLRKESKSLRMDVQQDNNEESELTGTIISQAPESTLVKIDRQITQKCTSEITDPEERWLCILSQLDSLNTEVNSEKSNGRKCKKILCYIM